MDWKKIGKALFFPPMALVIVLLPVALTGMLYGMLRLGENHPATIAFYALAFYALVIFCLRVPGMVRLFRRWKGENRLLLRWNGDDRLRMNVTLAAHVLWNGAYAALQLALGIRHESLWYFSLFGYYGCLTAMRFFLLRYSLRNVPGEGVSREKKIYRVCGWCLLAVNLTLSAIMFYRIRQNRLVRHHEITTIAMAAYTFATLTMAVVNALCCRKNHSPVTAAARTVSLASGLVSLLTLESTMLATFGSDMAPETQRMFLALSGGGVSIAIVAMAGHIIFRANRKIGEMEYGK